MINISTVCGMGLGTSMMLASQIRDLIKDRPEDIKVQPVDLGSFKSQPSDIVVTTTGMVGKVEGTKALVVAIDNLIDKNEVREKVAKALDEFTANQ